MRTLALLAVLLVAGSSEPKVLRGVPLHRPTRLQLLVADIPPYLLDVDSGRIQRIAGVRAESSVVTVRPSGRDALVLVDHVPGADVYLVRHSSRTATLISHSPRMRDDLTAARTGSSVTVTDRRTGARVRLPWPSSLHAVDGTVAHGRLVAVGFADPAYHGSGTQVEDVWLLDWATRRLTHLPDMPADVELKRTSMAWAPDGRLVFLARSGGRDVVGVWRPGQSRIAVKPVRLPERYGGSDAFVPWLAP